MCIRDRARAVVAVAGLTALGKPAGEVCFRKEQAERAFGIRPEEPVTPRLMARVLADENGQRKGVGQREDVYKRQAPCSSPAWESL